MVGNVCASGTAVAVVGLRGDHSRVWLLTDVPIPIQFATVEQAVATMSDAQRRCPRLERSPTQGPSGCSPSATRSVA